MFDANSATAYEYDTIVVDIEDADEGEVMHVYVLGRRHRRKPRLDATACGILYHSQFCPPFREELIGDLCVECFTDSEREDAAEANAKDTSRKGP
jgi:hypothetical protein